MNLKVISNLTSSILFLCIVGAIVIVAIARSNSYKLKCFQMYLVSLFTVHVFLSLQWRSSHSFTYTLCWIAICAFMLMTWLLWLKCSLSDVLSILYLDGFSFSFALFTVVVVVVAFFNLLYLYEFSIPILFWPKNCAKQNKNNVRALALQSVHKVSKTIMMMAMMMIVLLL